MRRQPGFSTWRGIYYGWRVVGVCFVAAVFTWGFVVFGASVDLHEVTATRGWSVALVSSAITGFYLTNAFSLTAVGGLIDRFGSRPVFICGALALALGVAGIGQAAVVWQLYAGFALMGLGYASLSLTGLTVTLAPWFERHQGRSMAIALMGRALARCWWCLCCWRRSGVSDLLPRCWAVAA